MIPSGVIITKNKNTPNIPVGLGMALSENVDALNYFGTLSKDEQQQIISHAHSVESKEEMQNYVDNFNKYF